VDTLPDGSATTVVTALPSPRLGWLKVATPSAMPACAHPSRLPVGSLKQPTRAAVSRPLTVAEGCWIGTVHCGPTTFQKSSSWSAKWLMTPGTV
jgi:hypothetical protein